MSSLGLSLTALKQPSCLLPADEAVWLGQFMNHGRSLQFTHICGLNKNPRVTRNGGTRL